MSIIIGITALIGFGINIFGSAVIEKHYEIDVAAAGFLIAAAICFK